MRWRCDRSRSAPDAQVECQAHHRRYNICAGKLKITVNYEFLGKQLDSLMSSEPDLLANSANFVSLLFAETPNFNWLGL